MIDAFYDMLGRLGYHHPVHAPFVHMPIGLVVGAFIFVVLALVFRRSGLVPTHRHCVILAFVMVFPVIALGIMDWRHFYHGAWLYPIKIKLITAPILAVLLGVSIFLGRARGRASLKVLPFYFLSLCAVTVLGYYGYALTCAGRAANAPQEFATGQRIFAARCAACHPNGGNTDDPSKPVLHSTYLRSEDAFRMWVRRPVSPMPAFQQSEISDAEVKELYEYIQNALSR